MRVSLVMATLGLVLLSACGDGSSGNGGGGSTSAGGSTNAGGGGAGGTTMSTGGTTMSTGGATMTTSSTTTSSAPTDLCATAGSTPISFADDVQPIFGQSCGGVSSCHLKATPSEGLSLKPGESYADLVDVPAKQQCNGQVRVKPGSASDSYLVNKIENVGVCPGEKKMPPSGSLNAANKQKIIDWICQGAANN